MKYAIVRFGYDASYLVEVGKLSAFLNALNSAVPVNYGYVSNRCVHYIDERRTPSVDLIDAYPVPKAEYEALRAEYESQETKNDTA